MKNIKKYLSMGVTLAIVLFTSAQAAMKVSPKPKKQGGDLASQVASMQGEIDQLQMFLSNTGKIIDRHYQSLEELRLEFDEFKRKVSADMARKGAKKAHASKK